jgi:macrodomain Ter protein organizer (MatP/YcbG family)
MSEFALDGKAKQSTIYELTYQIDIYKQNAKNAKTIEVENEATKIQEWLKSFEVEEYLGALGCEIYANYKPIRLTLNAELNAQFTNRASFDITIISTNQISEKIDIIEKVVFEKTLTI